MSEQVIRNILTAVAQYVDGLLKVYGIPDNDRSDNHIKSACAMLLIFMRPVSELAEPVEEYRSRECVPGFAFVQARMNAPPQVNVPDVLQKEQGAFQFTDFS
jgi:hypothetical protein